MKKQLPDIGRLLSDKEKEIINSLPSIHFLKIFWGSGVSVKLDKKASTYYKDADILRNMGFMEVYSNDDAYTKFVRS